MTVSPPAPDRSPVDAPTLRVTITSNTELSEEDFAFQRQMIKKVATWNVHTRIWSTALPTDDPQRMAEVLAHLFEVSRHYKAVIRVWADGVDAPSQPKEG
ncbi:hypothetical protein ACFV1N_33125 [Streptosporangium canum]|uniref:hypothetical protein n=1 Tax=Streptosporangium canum TaxID=324952 RepID=UPI0036ACBAD7